MFVVTLVLSANQREGKEGKGKGSGRRQSHVDQQLYFENSDNISSASDTTRRHVCTDIQSTLNSFDNMISTAASAPAGRELSTDGNGDDVPPMASSNSCIDHPAVNLRRSFLIENLYS
jgi:hypothetical protein